MKRTLTKVTWASLMLSASFGMTHLAYAGANPGIGGCGSEIECLSSILQVDNNILSSNDITRTQMVTALINYQAAAYINDYQLTQQWRYMQAPGVAWATNAGLAVGGQLQTAANTSNRLNNYSLMQLLAPYTSAKETNYGGQQIDLKSIREAGPLQSFDNLSGFFNSGDASGLSPYNPGQLLLSTNISAANLTTAQAQQMIANVVGKPTQLGGDPSVNGGMDPLQTLQGGNASNLSGAAKEQVINQMIQNATFTLSASALGDIVGRRTPAGGSNKSMMDVMDEYSKQRFTNGTWYQDIAQSSDSALLREMAHMQAFNTWLQYQQFKLQEQQTALLASMNAVLGSVSSGLQQLSVQMAKAQAQAQQAQAQSNSELQKQQDNLKQQQQQLLQQNESSGTTPIQ